MSSDKIFTQIRSSLVAFGVPGGDTVETNLSKAAGVPDHINHIAFDVADMDELTARKQSWLDAGLDVLEIDHHWCYSIYTKDPNHNLVEFCLTTAEFTAADRERALAAMAETEAVFSEGPASIELHRAE